MNQNKEQMIFDLRRPGKNGLENFYISGSNEVAVEAIKKWKTWPEKKLILLGESGSGKSHLVDFWAKESHGRFIKVFDLCGYDVIDLSQNEALIIENIDDSDNSAVEDYFGDYDIISLIDNAELRQAAMLSWKLVADDKTKYTSSYISETILHVAQWVDADYGGGSGGNPIWPPASGGPPGFPSPWFPPIQPYPSAEDYYMRGYVDGISQSIISGTLLAAK